MADKKPIVKKTAPEVKLSMIPSPISQAQLLQILQRTPKQHIHTRPAKGGGTWDYVSGTYVKKVLNYVFGWQWDFEIVEHGNENDQAWVLGRLTIHPNEKTRIVKMQFGRADIKKRKVGGTLDFGNDLKAAATDSLKRCAAELGIASDVYGQEEFKEIKVEQEQVKQTISKDEALKVANQKLTQSKICPQTKPIVSTMEKK